MFTVSHGSIVLQTHAKSMSCFLKCVNSKDLSGSTGLHISVCQTELCPSHQSHHLNGSTINKRSKAQFSCRNSSGLMPPPIDGWRWMGHLENTEPPNASCVQVGGSSWSVRSGRFDLESQGHPFHGYDGYELCPTRL